MFLGTIPFLKFTKNLGYIKKAIFGMEYLKGRPPLYLQNYKFINNKYLGGLPESIKNKFNYRTSFKIKEITRPNNPYLTTYKYIIEEKLLNIRIILIIPPHFMQMKKLKIFQCATNLILKKKDIFLKHSGQNI